MRRRARLDGNHRHIVATLRLYGWCVQSLAELGGGAPDLLCFHPGRNEWRLVEVKDGNEPLTPDQVAFMHQGWRVDVVRSIAGAAEL